MAVLGQQVHLPSKIYSYCVQLGAGNSDHCDHGDKDCVYGSEGDENEVDINFQNVSKLIR